MLSLAGILFCLLLIIKVLMSPSSVCCSSQNKKPFKTYIICIYIKMIVVNSRTAWIQDDSRTVLSKRVIHELDIATIKRRNGLLLVAFTYSSGIQEDILVYTF